MTFFFFLGRQLNYSEKDFSVSSPKRRRREFESYVEKVRNRWFWRKMVWMEIELRQFIGRNSEKIYINFFHPSNKLYFIITSRNMYFRCTDVDGYWFYIMSMTRTPIAVILYYYIIWYRIGSRPMLIGGHIHPDFRRIYSRRQLLRLLYSFIAASTCDRITSFSARSYFTLFTPRICGPTFTIIL